jgi:Coenzyme PQQ synthesis protein D (PqqD)
MSQVFNRTEGLEVHEVPDGYIVYQGNRDNVYYLNNTAAVVFEFCDGKRDAEDIVGRVAKIYDLAGSADKEIRDCVDTLVKQGLIQSNSQ